MPEVEQPQIAARNRLGMWVFLASEMLFFGALFTAYSTCRYEHPDGFATAAAHLNLTLGTVNTAVLLCSSFTVVLAVHASENRRVGLMRLLLLVTIILGLAFLGIKAVEYVEEFREGLFPGSGTLPEGVADARGFRLFYLFYFIMTSIHAVHMLIGIGFFMYLAGLTKRFVPASHAEWVEDCGLYWHFVDIVWIFLFPMLYLAGKSL